MDSPEQRLEHQQQMLAALKLETQFEVTAFNSRIDSMSRDDLAILAKDLFLHMQYQKQVFLELTKQNWGL